MENVNTKNFHNFAVIGLGRFGKSLSINLAELGKNVLAVDMDTINVEEISSYVTNAVVADITKRDVLQSLGLQPVHILLPYNLSVQDGLYTFLLREKEHRTWAHVPQDHSPFL